MIWWKLIITVQRSKQPKTTLKKMDSVMRGAPPWIILIQRIGKQSAAGNFRGGCPLNYWYIAKCSQAMALVISEGGAPCNYCQAKHNYWYIAKCSQVMALVISEGGAPCNYCQAKQWPLVISERGVPPSPSKV